MSELSVGQLKGLTINNNTITIPSGHKLYAPGSVVQTITATSGFVNQSFTSATPIALTGMSATITPKFANSKILIEAVVVASWTYVSAVHVYKNGVDLVSNHTANGANNQSGGATSIYTHYSGTIDASTDNVWPFPVMYWDTPGTTSAITYDIRANSGWSGGANAFYFNNRGAQDMLGSSHLKITEVAQ
jgi:hypothetical protein